MFKKESFVEQYYSGHLEVECFYKDGKLNKLLISRYENGQKEYQGTYKDGKRDELWTWWYENGHKRRETTYKDGKEMSFSHNLYLMELGIFGLSGGVNL